MKHLLLSTLFAVFAAIGFSSCMNGDYDADPLANNGGPNPLANNGNGGGSGGGNNLSKGQVSVTAKGKTVTLTGFYSEVGGGVLLSGGGPDGSTILQVMLNIGSFTGAGQYNLASGSNSANYGESTVSPAATNMWSVNSNGKAGSGSVNVTSSANNEIKGTFSFTAQLSQGTGDNEIPVSGSFYVAKQ